MQGKVALLANVKCTIIEVFWNFSRFSPCKTGERNVQEISKPCKNRALESYSNILFPLKQEPLFFFPESCSNVLFLLDYTLELPCSHALLEMGSSSCCRVHNCYETSWANPIKCTVHGRPIQGGWVPWWSYQRHNRVWANCRSGYRKPSRYQQSSIYRYYF